jgi:hypothetical protein
VIDSKKTGGLSKSDISFLNDTRHIWSKENNTVCSICINCIYFA